MKHEFTAVIERDGDWFIAYCPEIPGANGQGRTIDECRSSLAEAIALIRDDAAENQLHHSHDRRQTDITNLFGTIDFDPSYNYKHQRNHR